MQNVGWKLYTVKCGAWRDHDRPYILNVSLGRYSRFSSGYPKSSVPRTWIGQHLFLGMSTAPWMWPERFWKVLTALLRLKPVRTVLPQCVSSVGLSRGYHTCSQSHIRSIDNHPVCRHDVVKSPMASPEPQELNAGTSSVVLYMVFGSHRELSVEVGV